MKKLFILFLLHLFVSSAYCQQQTFDLIKYAVPAGAGWKKDAKPDVIVYSNVDQGAKTWCQIALYQSTISKGSIEADLQNEWNELAAKPLQIREPMQASEIKQEEGWKIRSASGKFNFNQQPASAILTTFSGFNRCISILATTNSARYLENIEKFMAGINLIKPAEATTNNSPVTGGSTAIAGQWGKSNGITQLYNRFGDYSYNKQQYTFNKDGTYMFVAKTYGDKYDETLLTLETGRYSIKGNLLTVTPQSCVLEAWSKKNGGDNWNQRKSSQKKKLETTTYQFTISNNNLILQTDRPTARDGNFNSGNMYSYGPPGTFTPVKLPGK